jgi:hypothetical protein
VTGRKRKSRVE